MQAYLDLLAEVLHNGQKRSDRTGTGTLSLFGKQLRFCDIWSQFPLVTTKAVHLKSIIYELLWFIKGSTNIGYLNDNGVTIWDEWADEHGDLGPVYGKQWRNWNGIDQLQQVIDNIKTDPYSRRLLVSAWNVDDLPKMHLQPCHALFQFYVSDGYLSCHLYQRSADIFLGVPFNIASYALLTMMIAHVCGLKAQDLVISFGDVHLYSNHLEQAEIQLARKPLAMPCVQIDKSVTSIDDFNYHHFTLLNYQSHAKITAPVAV